MHFISTKFLRSYINFHITSMNTYCCACIQLFNDILVHNYPLQSMCTLLLIHKEIIVTIQITTE